MEQGRLGFGVFVLAAGALFAGFRAEAQDLPRPPAIWFHPQPALANGPLGPTGSADFLALFQANAPWPRALAHTRVVGLYAGWVVEATGDVLQSVIAFLNAHNLGIELEAPALQATATCGTGVEGYVPFGQSLHDFTLAYLHRLQTLGANVLYIKVDEPFFFGSVVNDPRSCHLPVPAVASAVAAYAQLVRTVYPYAAVGDVEPISPAAYPADVAAAIGQWHDTYRNVSGAPFPFYFADADFSDSAWPAIVKTIEDGTRQRGIQFGIIYIGDLTDVSDEAWTAKAVERFRVYEGVTGGRPSYALFQSWEPHPKFCLPESNPASFTGVIDAYIDASRRLHPQPRNAEAGRMAFVSRHGSVNQIYLMDVDPAGVGSNPVRLTSDREPENYPSWSPDGKRLVYQRDFNGAAIYLVNADGAGQQRLSPTPGFDVTPGWSPDGARIVYVRLLEIPQPNQPPKTDIRVMNADGTGDHAILANTIFSVEPRWSVNGQVVFMSLMSGAGALQIHVMNADGTGLRQLTTAANNGDPVWSPDGTRITFGSDREGGNRLNIFAMNADGSQQEQLTHFAVPYEAGDTNWSGDGKKIAFQRDINGMKQSDPNAYAEVWTMNADGSGAASTGVQCSDVGCAPRWQPRVCKPALYNHQRPLGLPSSSGPGGCSAPVSPANGR